MSGWRSPRAGRFRNPLEGLRSTFGEPVVEESEEEAMRYPLWALMIAIVILDSTVRGAFAGTERPSTSNTPSAPAVAPSATASLR
jgi:hypothetical protein